MEDGLAYTRRVPATVHIASAQPDAARAATSADTRLPTNKYKNPASSRTAYANERIEKPQRFVGAEALVMLGFSLGSSAEQ
jgi:hypothetical protein